MRLVQALLITFLVLVIVIGGSLLRIYVDARHWYPLWRQLWRQKKRAK